MLVADHLSFLYREYFQSLKTKVAEKKQDKRRGGVQRLEGGRPASPRAVLDQASVQYSDP